MSTSSTIYTKHKLHSKSRQNQWRYSFRGVGINYTAEQISLPRDPQTQAQTSKGGGSGDVGDIFSMSSYALEVLGNEHDGR